MNENKPILDILHAVAGPIVVANVGWGETLPDWIKTQIQLERLAQNMRRLKGEKVDEATDAEILAYFYTASLTAPISHDYAELYMHIFSKYKKVSGIPSPELNNYQRRLLADLKREIYKSSMKSIKTKLKSDD